MKVLVGLVVVGAALGLNVFALVALRRGLRGEDAPSMKRRARICWLASAGLWVLVSAAQMASVLAVMADESLASVDPSERATRLGEAISEGMNMAAWGAVVIPVAAGIALYVGARRRERSVVD